MLSLHELWYKVSPTGADAAVCSSCQSKNWFFKLRKYEWKAYLPIMFVSMTEQSLIQLNILSILNLFSVNSHFQAAGGLACLSWTSLKWFTMYRRTNQWVFFLFFFSHCLFLLRHFLKQFQPATSIKTQSSTWFYTTLLQNKILYTA